MNLLVSTQQILTNNESSVLPCRTMYILADVMDDQLKSMWFSPFQAEEIETDLDMVNN